MDASESQRAVDYALQSRRSVRAFLPDPIPDETIKAILRLASRSPSGTNIQPWKVHVVTGPSRDRLSAALLEAFDLPEHAKAPDARPRYEAEYQYYPTTWTSPYIDRRRKVGWELYGLLNIGRDDKAGMHRQHARNFAFFGAPVALFVTVDRVMETGAFLDCGMFLQAIMTAARGRGLDTCAQAAFLPYHQVIAEQLAFEGNEKLICGMAMGWADTEAVVNKLETERSPVEVFARFHK